MSEEKSTTQPASTVSPVIAKKTIEAVAPVKEPLASPKNISDNGAVLNKEYVPGIVEYKDQDCEPFVGSESVPCRWSLENLGNDRVLARHLDTAKLFVGKTSVFNGKLSSK